MNISIKRIGKGLFQATNEIKRIQNFSSFLKEVGQNLESSTKLRFNKGTDPDGNEWKPRSEKYKEYLRKKRRLNNKVLVLTGQLQKSISYAYDSKEVNIGTDIDYGVFHQEGSGHMPKREFLGISSDDEQKIEKIVEKHIQGK